MNYTKREMLKLFTATGITGGAVAALGGVRLAEAAVAGNQICVGSGGDYADIGTALASITDNSPTNPYQILLLPGIYGGFDSKPYVDIVGSGVKSSIIETGFLAGDYIRIGSHVHLDNMGIKYSGTTGSASVRGAIQKQSGEQTEVILSNIEVEVHSITGVSAPKYAVNFGGKVDLTAYNLRVKTDSGGLRLSYGNSRWHSCDIYLTGTSVGAPHYGVVLESGNRFDWYGGRIGTGYYYDQELNDSEQDVIGLYIPATNTTKNCRAQIHNAEMFARNMNAPDWVKVNAVRAENGWVRLFGCYCQAEVDPTINSNKSVYGAFRTSSQPASGNGGKVEAYGCRIRSIEGYVVGGAGTQGFFEYSSGDNGKQVQRYENLCLCDADNGPFTLLLAADDPATTGDEHIFKKTDSTANSITIDGNGTLIDGFSQRELTTQNQVIRIRRARNQWYVL